MHPAALPAWQAKVEAAIAASRQSAPQPSSYALASGARAHVSLNVGRGSGLY
jgi:hypothetical protein